MIEAVYIHLKSGGIHNAPHHCLIMFEGLLLVLHLRQRNHLRLHTTLHRTSGSLHHFYYSHHFCDWSLDAPLVRSHLVGDCGLLMRRPGVNLSLIHI